VSPKAVLLREANYAPGVVPHRPVDRRGEKILMRFNICSAKAPAILVLGTSGLAFMPDAGACGERHGHL
jgi:hypothetical protein